MENRPLQEWRERGTGRTAGVDKEEEVGPRDFKKVDAREVVAVGAGVERGDAGEVRDEVGHGGLREGGGQLFGVLDPQHRQVGLPRLLCALGQ